MFEAQIVDSEYMTFMYLAGGLLVTLANFLVGKLLWQVFWCTQKKNVPEKLEGLLIYWAASVIGIGFHLALKTDPLLANSNVQLGIAAGVIVGSVIYLMTAAKITLLAYMRKEHKECNLTREAVFS